jgi:hypothetical protein
MRSSKAADALADAKGRFDDAGEPDVLAPSGGCLRVGAGEAAAPSSEDGHRRSMPALPTGRPVASQSLRSTALGIDTVEGEPIAGGAGGSEEKVVSASRDRLPAAVSIDCLLPSLETAGDAFADTERRRPSVTIAGGAATGMMDQCAGKDSRGQISRSGHLAGTRRCCRNLP